MKEMTDLEFLKAVRHRIRVPQLWCREDYERGHRRCLIGAARQIVFSGSRNLSRLLGMEECEIERFNDDSTHAQVLAKLDVAIQRLESAS